MTTPTTAGRAVKAARKHAGISQAELARRIRCDHSAVSRWESGERPLHLDIARAIAEATGTDPDRLIVTAYCSPAFARLAERELFGGRT